MINLDPILKVIHEAVGVVAPAIQVEVRHHGTTLLTEQAGWLDPDHRCFPVTPNSRFDLASVTKLFTTAAFMRLVEMGKIRLDQPVKTILPAFSGIRPIAAYEDPLHAGIMIPPASGEGQTVNTDRITFRNLLVHNSGLPAWRPLKDQADRESALNMAMSTSFFYPPGSKIVYSDIGLILTGLAIETITGLRLDRAIQQMVLSPLHLSHTEFLPIGEEIDDLSIYVPTEWCQWRQRRVIAEVHDENAARLGGIAGHAGLFSNAHDLAAFGEMFLKGGEGFLHPDTIKEMTREQTEYEKTRRGIGFVLWHPDPDASSNPLSQKAYGHTGFTGTSLWMDPERQLVIAAMTNRVYYGRDADAILTFRVALHKSIVEVVDK
ncbi:MAG TPA: serine hydrolase domain-containing protein [Anaerolineaceae bacterium]|nr:serine hydrolase domain-containing protein [Anaerolineaceae bacterium]HPN52344.1 serine hydrolase domain-containing protein [Anaerolineaceae bacterium]